MRIDFIWKSPRLCSYMNGEFIFHVELLWLCLYACLVRFAMRADRCSGVRFASALRAAALPVCAGDLVFFALAAVALASLVA